MAIQRADVVVVGLGPAGASAAAEAARRGCRVIAVDRRREAGRPVQCAEFVPALIGLDVREVACAVRQPIRAMHTYVENDAVDVEPRFPGQMLDRAEFDARLVAQAASVGVQCRFGCRVRHFTREGEVELSDGAVLAAPVTIGADGPRSVVGRAIGHRNTDLVETRQITVMLNAPHDATDVFLASDIPGGYGWLFPKGRVANLGAGVSPHARSRLGGIVRALHQRLQAEGRVGGEVLGMTGGPIPVGGMVGPWRRAGETLVLLAGDAAGLANPVTGAGIAAAVASGRLAGECAARVVQGETPDGVEYEDELRSIFGPALERALLRRRALLDSAERKVPDRVALRRSWVAYPEYWAA